jgi:FkbM family methyltransferase
MRRADLGFKHAVYEKLNRGPGRWLIGPVASAVALTKGERAWVSYDSSSGLWLKRTCGGDMLMFNPRELGVEQRAALTRDAFCRHYTVGPGDVVLEIGAGIGADTIAFSRMVGQSGKVLSVEAHPATFARLRRLCQLNSLGNVELVQAAVTDSDRPVTISDLPVEKSDENRIGGEGVAVPATTIPELVSKFRLDRIDFLAMNIEGAERAALEGAREVLPIVENAAISCHDFVADVTGDGSYRTKDKVHALLVEAGFNVIPRGTDPRPWAADFLYASR